jgi:hypothetical protein
MISQEQITHQFFILGVVAAAVIPRQPSDNAGFWSVGGRLSHNFRKLLLALLGVNFCRLFLSDDNVPRGNEESGSYQLGSDLLGVVEVTGLTFLCFAVPYVLQEGLSQYFRIIPGQSLKLPLFVAATLSFLGVVLSRAVHPNFWALKKIANAVTGPPVIRTLRSYNTFTGAEAHGRGFVFAQTVVVIEYWHCILQILCAAAYALNRHTDGTTEETLFDRTLHAMRSIAFAADWTRVLMHAAFLNQLDELHHTWNFRDDVDAFPENHVPAYIPVEVVDESNMPLALPGSGRNTAASPRKSPPVSGGTTSTSASSLD